MGTPRERETKMLTNDLIIEGLDADVNGNAKTPGRSPQATVKHIALMADHLRREFSIAAHQAALAARALHNLHDFRLNTLQRTRGPLTGEIINTAIKNAQ